MSFQFESARLARAVTVRRGANSDGDTRTEKIRSSPLEKVVGVDRYTHSRGIWSDSEDVGVTLRSAVSWSGLPE